MKEWKHRDGEARLLDSQPAWREGNSRSGTSIATAGDNISNSAGELARARDRITTYSRPVRTAGIGDATSRI